MNYFQSCCQYDTFLSYILGVFAITYSKEKKNLKTCLNMIKIVTLDSSHTITGRKVKKKSLHKLLTN